MTGSDLMCKIDDDGEIAQIKNVESPSSRSNTPTNTSKSKRTRLTFPFGACRVCSDSATGIHYGIATCEGCKGFFKRSILRKEKYRCYFDSKCLVNVTNRNRCKACRFRRCLDEGMSVDGVKMGRIPKLVKERALREQKEEQTKKESTAMEVNEPSNEEHARESSCSSLSDRSIENYDPNLMNTDIIKLHASAIQQHHSKLSKNSSNTKTNSLIFNDRIGNHSIISEHDINSNQKKSDLFINQINYPSFLPDDYTLDETNDLTGHSKEPLADDIFKHVDNISHKTGSQIQLTEDELLFIRFLRWSSYNVYLRHSQRVKQLENRMNQMIFKGINVYPGDNATQAQLFATIPRTLELLVRSSVFYIQELPGMTNMDMNNLHKMILHRSFDWFMLKYTCLFNENGQCYFLTADGLQATRQWINMICGNEMADAMFKFSQCIRELYLSESEFSLLFPLQMCHPDSTMEDQETARVLRSCYLYALHQELSYNRGEQEGKILCSKILQILDRLVLLNEMYEKNVGSRVLEA